MDALMLSRIQFALTAGFHFIFVPLTIGLIVIVAIIESMYAKTKDPVYEKMSDFWGKLFAINFVFGIVTGMTMEFQIGMNWSEYSAYMGDIFGAPLAVEALAAFFLESTFMGVWWFGRKRLKTWIRVLSIWCVAVGTNISALWIITANGFMQNPVGYVLGQDSFGNERIELASIGELLTNPYAWYMLGHTVLGAYIVGSFFVLAVSAWHLVRKQHIDFFKRSFKIAAVFGLCATILTPTLGHFYGVYVGKVNPTKAAAFEAVWETHNDGSLGFPLILIVDEENEKNIELLTIPKLGSFFYTNSFNGDVKGLKEVSADERPPVAVVTYAFRVMVITGSILALVGMYAFYVSRKESFAQNRFEQHRRFLKIMPWMFILPYITINAGWMVSEIGRQPWSVVGLIRTEDAVSPLATGQIVFSLGVLGVFYVVLGLIDLYFMLKFAKKGPEESAKDESVREAV